MDDIKFLHYGANRPESKTTLCCVQFESVAALKRRMPSPMHQENLDRQPFDVFPRRTVYFLLYFGLFTPISALLFFVLYYAYVSMIINVGSPYCPVEMYAGLLACLPLASHGEYANGTDGQAEGRTLDRYTKLSAGRGQRDASHDTLRYDTVYLRALKS